MLWLKRGGGNMAAKKTVEVKGSSVTVTGLDSTGIIDVIKVYGNGNTVKARKGNDQVTVYKGKNHKIYGDAGHDYRRQYCRYRQ